LVLRRRQALQLGRAAGDRLAEDLLQKRHAPAAAGAGTAALRHLAGHARLGPPGEVLQLAPRHVEAVTDGVVEFHRGPQPPGRPGAAGGAPPGPDPLTPRSRFSVSVAAPLTKASLCRVSGSTCGIAADAAGPICASAHRAMTTVYRSSCRRAAARSSAFDLAPGPIVPSACAAEQRTNCSGAGSARALAVRLVS